MIIRKKYFTVALLVVFSSLTVNAQYQKNPANSPDTVNTLAFYHTVKNAPATRQYLHLKYTRPNNQLMSWPNYPLTPEEFMRRADENNRNNKPGNAVAKDIITSILSKKKKIAVIPKF